MWLVGLAVTQESPRPFEPPSSGQIRSWASHLACESREISWVTSYVVPNAVGQLVRLLSVSEGAIIGLVGYQGVGKSSALLWIYVAKLVQEKRECGRRHETEAGDYHEDDVVQFKWRREPELFTSLFDGTHEMSYAFKRSYGLRLLEQFKTHFPLLDFREIQSKPETLNFNRAEKAFGSQRVVNESRKVVWWEILRGKKTILIDMPDYSKTDKRAMAKDLEEIYWLWNYLSNSLLRAPKPNLVIAIQKEMFRGHFFFDKMQRIELEPLQPSQMVEAYTRRFKGAEPFADDALLTLARLSRGIFRRFLRYISLTLDLWEAEGRKTELVDTPTVKGAITTERLAEDMELELSELFPKHSDLRAEAVRVLLCLQESGPTKQGELAEKLEIEGYALSRLLTKLEVGHYISRVREGNDKIVSLP